MDTLCPTQSPFCPHRCSELCVERINRFYKQLEAICYLSTAAFVHAEMTMKTRPSCISMNSPTFLCVEGATLRSSNKQPSVFTWEDTANLQDILRSKRSHCTCWHPGLTGLRSHSLTQGVTDPQNAQQNYAYSILQQEQPLERQKAKSWPESTISADCSLCITHTPNNNNNNDNDDNNNN